MFEPAVGVLCKGDHLLSHSIVKSGFLSAGVRAGCLVGQCLAADGLILQL